MVRMKDMLRKALEGGYAVGYFEAWDQYSFEAVLEAAEEVNSPVILGFGGVMMNQEWFDAGGLEALAVMGESITQGAGVPISFLLNEVETLEQVKRGLAFGFNAVMLDTSHLPFEENIEQTRKVVVAARASGADAEGECNPLPDASGTMDDHSGSKLTDPDEAAQFVKETGVAALSVAIGNEHIRIQGESAIDFDLLARIQVAVDVPLVIHGGTGFPDSAVPRAIELGVAKINVGSILKQLYLDGVRQSMLSLPDIPNFQELVGSRKETDFLVQAKLAVKNEVIRRMRIYGSAGKA